ncbi:Conserved_hypothetical protein [Hexamita inflata]|uniref:Uncharacterized protein n=1 Tax=Hexamita inflata TaxID=28002 RepID=A0AA86NDZ0_9EUKA|nr:Conserved hypothetical protein [Hexamita inflata]
MFIYTDIAKESVIEVQFNYVNIFAIFGFNIQSQIVQDSSINVSITFQIVTGALVCIQCNIYVVNSRLIFIATGSKLSAIMAESLQKIAIYNASIQYRFTAKQSAGITVLINEHVNITISNSRIIGQDFIANTQSGYFISLLNHTVEFLLHNVNVCTNLLTSIGIKNVIFILNETEQQQCNQICNQSYHTYGICQPALHLGVIEQYQYICKYPFVFNEDSCICDTGYLLNQSYCVNIILQLTQLDIQLSQNMSNITDYIIQNVNQLNQNIQTSFNLMDQQLQHNTSVLEARLKSNISLNELYMKQNASEIYSNISVTSLMLQNYINGNVSMLDSKLLQNTSYLESKIISNFSASDNNLKRNTTYLESNILTNSSKAQQNLVQTNDYLEAMIKSNWSDNVQKLKYNSSTLEQWINGNATIAANNLRTTDNTLKSIITQTTNALNARIDSLTASTNSGLSTLTVSINNVQGGLNNEINIRTSNVNSLSNSINYLSGQIGSIWSNMYTKSQVDARICRCGGGGGGPVNRSRAFDYDKAQNAMKQKKICDQKFKDNDNQIFNFPFYSEYDSKCCASKTQQYVCSADQCKFEFVCGNWEQSTSIEVSSNLIQDEIFLLCGASICSAQINEE